MKIIAISNPISGNKNKKNIKAELNRLLCGHCFEIWETQQPLHAIKLAQKAVP